MPKNPLDEFISDALMDHLRVVATISLLIEKKVFTMEEYQKALMTVSKEVEARREV
jgi:hypothetical protein